MKTAKSKGRERNMPPKKRAKKILGERKIPWSPDQIAALKVTLEEKGARFADLASRIKAEKLDNLPIDGQGVLAKGLLQIDVFIAKLELAFADQRLSNHRSRRTESQ